MRTYEVTMQVTTYQTVTVNTEERVDHYELEHLASQKLEEQGIAGHAKHWMSKDLTPVPRPVKDRVNASFKALRKDGFIARMGYQCCSSCAWAAMETDYNATEDSNVVFYHRQDADAFDGKHLANYYEYENGERVMKTRHLYLVHQGESHKVVEALEAQGLTVEWDGTMMKRIAVTGTKEGTL